MQIGLNVVTSHAIFLVVILLQPNYVAKGQNRELKDSICVPLNEPFTIPLGNVSDLTYLSYLNGIEHNSDSLIIIYSFTGCKPCLVLAKKVNEEILKGKIDSRQIIYVNTFVPDTFQLTQNLLKADYQFAYYRTQWPYPGVTGQFYPIISKYGIEGKYIESEGGFDFGTVKRMKDFLNQ